MIEKVNIAQKLERFHEHWSVGERNDSPVKLAKGGRLCIKLRDRDLWLEPGEFADDNTEYRHC